MKWRGKMQRNILSIDFESWVHFHSDATKSDSLKNRFTLTGNDENYVTEMTRKILDLLDTYGQKATFFIVSELYSFFPECIELIHERGHEIAYHTHSHSVLTGGAKQLLAEFEKSKKFLARFKPIGFRAPYNYVTQDAIDCLAAMGFRYSSSSYDLEERIFLDGIHEIPVATRQMWSTKETRDGKPFIRTTRFPKHLILKLLLTKIPFGSGFFISLLGGNTSKFIEGFNERGRPAVLFVHPWQLYHHPRISGWKFKAKVLLKNPFCLPYTKCILKTMHQLLKRHRFTSFKEYYKYDNANGKSDVLGPQDYRMGKLDPGL